jgi:hypothetical protein
MVPAAATGTSWVAVSAYLSQALIVQAPMLPVVVVRLKVFFEHRANDCGAKINVHDRTVYRFDLFFRAKGMCLILLALAGWLQTINMVQGAIHNISLYLEDSL